MALQVGLILPQASSIRCFSSSSNPRYIQPMALPRARTKRQGTIHNNGPPLSLYQTEIPGSDRIIQVQKSTKRNQSEQPTIQSRIQPLSLFLFAILKLPGPSSYIPVAGRSKGDFPADSSPPSPSAPRPWPPLSGPSYS